MGYGGLFSIRMSIVSAYVWSRVCTESTIAPDRRQSGCQSVHPIASIKRTCKTPRTESRARDRAWKPQFSNIMQLPAEFFTRRSLGSLSVGQHAFAISLRARPTKSRDSASASASRSNASITEYRYN